MSDNKKPLEWFKERIGQKVYRKHNFCKCYSCLNVWEHGVVIKNETHADYLYSIELDTDLNYFDKEEKND